VDDRRVLDHLLYLATKYTLEVQANAEPRSNNIRDLEERFLLYIQHRLRNYALTSNEELKKGSAA